MKNNGFTLIELLAVIVILAIIALIAVPIILDLIGNTKVSAVKRSAENYIDAVELYLVRSELDQNKVTLERNNKYNVTNSTVIEEKTYPKINDLVEVSGSKPTGIEDYVQLNEKGKVIDAKLTIGGYEVEIKDGKITSVKGGATIALESISLNMTNQTMEKDSTFKLIPTFAPSNASNQEVTYESSDTNIVTVDAQGNVTANKVGTAKITVTSKENPNIKAECNITVVINATGVSITSNTNIMAVSEKIQLIGTIEPSNVTTNSLSWKSSNADIASVDANGLVTGVSVGEVTITASTVNGIEATKVITVKEQYQETILNGSNPEVYNGLTPVTYNGTNWIVTSRAEEWHNYTNQEWANTLILKEGISKTLGEEVDVTNEVTAMFVWIPRYEYKIEGQYGTHTDGTAGTKEQPGEIKVNFISKNNNATSEGYIIHPAFIFGSTQQSGIWVGKFETTGTAGTPTILPSVNSLRNQNISEQFTTAQKFNEYVNNSITDFHMSKNSEWGAPAYLSQSIYGKYGNENYVGVNKQVMINNCSSFITGIGADSQDASSSSSTCMNSRYTTAQGQAASTTGNITGVYDMSGGAYEYVMGALNKIVGNSGFTTWPDAKYYDNYTTIDPLTACSNEICYGHALSETSGWYSDYANFVSSSRPWFFRGGRYASILNAGVFYFDLSNGTADSYYSFRVVITRL